MVTDASGECSQVFVSVERADSYPQGVGTADVRVEGLDSTPMTPAQAMQLAATLQSAASTAIFLGGAR